MAVRNLRVIGLSLLFLGVVALRPGGYLPLMYVIAVLPLAAVAVAASGSGYSTSWPESGWAVLRRVVWWRRSSPSRPWCRSGRSG